MRMHIGSICLPKIQQENDFLLDLCKKDKKIGNSVLHMGAYAPATEKSILTFQKISYKNSCVYLDVLCACKKFREKLTFFTTCIKKTKKNLAEKTFLAPKFVFLHTTQKTSIFVKRLHKHVEYRDVHVKFFIQFFSSF